MGGQTGGRTERTLEISFSASVLGRLFRRICSPYERVVHFVRLVNEQCVVVGGLEGDVAAVVRSLV